MTAKLIVPELAVVVQDDFQVTLRGGINCRDGNKRPFFAAQVTYTDRGGEEVIPPVAQEDLDLFPEFEDLFKMVLSDGVTGEPFDAFGKGMKFLGFTGEHVYDARAVADHFRIGVMEGGTLFMDIMKAGLKHERDETFQMVAENTLLDWIKDQRPRWQADADAVIWDHDLVRYGAE